MRVLSLVLVLVAAPMIAGCIAEEPSVRAASGSDNGPVSAPAGEVDESTGALAGLIIDEELQPIPGAEAGLFETDFVASAASDGSFSFSLVPPGDYLLLVGALGHASRSLVVSIVAGEVTTTKVTLANVPIAAPRAELFLFNGYITCTIGAFGALSEECGQGLQTDVGTFGTNPNNKIDYRWNVTDVTNLQDTVLELDWQPGSAAASQLTLYVAHGFKCTPSCTADGGELYCGTDNHGPPAQLCVIDDLEIDDPTSDLPWDMTARAWGAPVGATEVPNIVLEQAFVMYRTEFYGEGMPRDYTAIPDA
jgi:hypothetical protein